MKEEDTFEVHNRMAKERMRDLEREKERTKRRKMKEELPDEAVEVREILSDQYEEDDTLGEE